MYVSMWDVGKDMRGNMILHVSLCIATHINPSHKGSHTVITHVYSVIVLTSLTGTRVHTYTVHFRYAQCMSFQNNVCETSDEV